MPPVPDFLLVLAISFGQDWPPVPSSTGQTSKFGPTFKTLVICPLMVMDGPLSSTL